MYIIKTLVRIYKYFTLIIDILFGVLVSIIYIFISFVTSYDAHIYFSF